MDLFFDNEFRALIPPLQPEERRELEASLIRDGNRDPVVIWKETRLLLDGHNRYDICAANDIPLKPAIEINLQSRDDAKIWIINNQFGRRNLSAYSRSVLALKLTDLYTTKAKTNQAIHANTAPGRNGTLLQNSVKVNTQFEIAKAAHVSHDTIARVKTIECKADNATKAALVTGDMSINDAYEKIKRLEKANKQAEIVKNNTELVKATAPTPASATYKTILIDPPWNWGDEGDVNQFGRAKPEYATMPLEEIANLPIGTLSDKDSHIYLWITNRSLPKGFGLLETWGFRYITLLTWCKPSFGMGNYYRGQTEHLLFGVKGSCPLLRHDAGTWFAADRGELHSSKPDKIYEIIESCSPGPWLEMFARSKRAGWVSWGAEVD